jgi:hypothetical protein
MQTMKQREIKEDSWPRGDLALGVQGDFCAEAPVLRTSVGVVHTVHVDP